MRRLIVSLSLLGLLAFGVFWVVTRPDVVEPEEVAALTGDAAAGEAIFWAGGCASCHAASDAEGEARLVLAGGQALASDFGTFRAPNISPHAEAGIGGWSLADFVTAMQNGISPEGRHYYPAFPYTAYRLMARQDIADLFAFLQTLPESDTASQPHDVPFPVTIRRGVGLWNLINLSDDFAVTGDLTPEQDRGRYLSEALAHCGECHTPRDMTGGLRRDAWFAGAPNPSRDGRVPALTPDALDWSEADIAAYLRDGFTPEFDVAGGNMASVVENLAMLPDADRAAIAAYLKVVPAAE